jgi:carotenoid phi-ring synthase / carotenoid chi-ring synthase
MKAVVVGGGIAGLSAATALAERGAEVTLLERESFLGGRAGSWPDRLATGEAFEMERGFHGFFRHYKALRDLLRRVDPALSLLAPAADYPILGPDGQSESFAGLPRRAPWNVAALALRTPTLRARDLLGIRARPALAMLRFDMGRSYRRWDGTSAKEYLDSLGFPPAARRMLFDVFAHSFFCAEEEMSAGELLMMFQYYFVGNRDGLVFDLATRPMSRAFWQPLAEVRTGTSCASLTRAAGGWRVEVERGATLEADAVVLALALPALQAVVQASPDLSGPWRDDLLALPLTRPFAVLRLWLDRPMRPERAPFAGTTGFGHLDNISLYDRFQDQSRAWASRTGGSVVELHASAVEPSMAHGALAAELGAGLHAAYPESRGARELERRFLWRQDCPGFPPGIHARRPTVTTPLPALCLAGDFVRLPEPSALMERAAASGLAAAEALAPAARRTQGARR